MYNMELKVKLQPVFFENIFSNHSRFFFFLSFDALYSYVLLRYCFPQTTTTTRENLNLPTSLGEI
jgi:hypothetical protein